VSPYGSVHTSLAILTRDLPPSHARARGVLDFLGRNFYAPNTMQVPDGPPSGPGVWVNVFRAGTAGRAACRLPRSVDPWCHSTAQLRQNPAPQLSKLRGGAVEQRTIGLDNDGKTLMCRKTTHDFELRADIDLKTRKASCWEIKDRWPRRAAK